MSFIISTMQPAAELQNFIEKLRPNKVFIVADSVTSILCLPILKKDCTAISDSRLITVEAGEDNKSLASAQNIWMQLEKGNATRNSLLIAIGGGMITDLAGFAAATFKRGLHVCYIPTTLLGAADASVGGKTGINFNGLKNEIGVFRIPDAVILSPIFFNTLPKQQLVSGYAEMVKMAWLFNPKMLNAMLCCDPTELDRDTLLQQLDFCINKKSEITTADLYDQGKRRMLNFGHTAGHAFEALCNSRNQPPDHGTCVAYGMLYALILSHLCIDMPSEYIYQYKDFLLRNYHSLPIGCADITRLRELMNHDKKNAVFDTPSFILLKSPGFPVADCQCSDNQLTTAFELFNDLR